VNSEAAAAAQQPFVSACINKLKFMAAAAPIEAIGCCTFAACHTSHSIRHAKPHADMSIQFSLSPTKSELIGLIKHQSELHLHSGSSSRIPLAIIIRSPLGTFFLIILPQLH
jgi:hypothetical protein